jgi:methyl-accepting chemotaxis protein
MTTTAAAPSEQTGSYKRSVRNYLLDARFQLKYTGMLVAVVVVISAIMGAVLFHSTSLVVSESSAFLEESRKVSDIEQMRKMVKQLGYSPDDLQGFFDEYNAGTEQHDKAVADQQARLLHNQTIMIWSLGGGLALMVLLIGLLGIYFTHKVVGPIYKMKRLLRQVGEGNLRVDARLRKGDELQDFFDAFTQMVAGLRQFEKLQIAEIETAIEAIDHDKKTDAQATLTRMRDTMKAGIGAA